MNLFEKYRKQHEKSLEDEAFESIDGDRHFRILKQIVEAPVVEIPDPDPILGTTPNTTVEESSAGKITPTEQS